MHPLYGLLGKDLHEDEWRDDHKKRMMLGSYILNGNFYLNLHFSMYGDNFKKGKRDGVYRLS